MHPIERLRYVARIGPDRPDLVAREAAPALLACAGRPAELVVACRRLLDRQPAAGPLWWLASSALTAADPAAAVLAAVEALEDDPTPDVLAAALDADDGAADVLTLDAWAVGAAGILTSPHEATGARGVRDAGFRVWAVGGVGRALPAPVWDAALRRIERLPDPDEVAVLAPEHLDAVVDSLGVRPFDPGTALAGTDFPLAPELLGRPRR